MLVVIVSSSRKDTIMCVDGASLRSVSLMLRLFETRFVLTFIQNVRVIALN